ncbi:MAG: type ISP restriction/modification enzyme [Pseudomonadota bacterium]
MSTLLVADYQRRIAELLQYGGSANEDSIRKAFARLLDDVARPHDLRLIEELEVVTSKGTKVYPDGTLKDALRLTHGYWEAKDEHDDLDEEIAKKRAKGYPSDNILYEDSREAVLIQNGQQVQRVSLGGEPKLIADLLKTFVEFERAELGDFRRAIEQFKVDMPKVLEALRALIEAQQADNKPFAKALKTFLKLCQSSINESVTADDVREMLIQHVLTEDIFLRVFGDSQFHRENNIARELTKVAETFFTGGVKKNTLRGLESYYGAIREAAAGIADHHEKQQFLKAIYENFYKVYNPKLADRLGVVYTPGELVRFMLDGVDALLHRHFGKTLASKNVEILDPAVGTGTFITDLIEHLKAHPQALKHKYKNEIHCNEVAILPYYIANLNIEFTYAQLTKSYEEFPHICFVDTLDNLAFEQTHTGQQLGLLGSMSSENTDRIAKQNKKKISVVIGNPPYNANQTNENDNNKNRLYEGIDERIKKTWIAASKAQKTKMYDMYARFFRWAADRVNSDGIIAFVTNRSFIDSRTFDGFRLEMAKEFDEAWVVDLGGDVRANPKLSGTTHNVFGIQTGVAISFWVKRHRASLPQRGRAGVGASQGLAPLAGRAPPSVPPGHLPPLGGEDKARIFYVRRPELETAADKLGWLSSTGFNEVAFEPVTPDAKGNWINQADNDFDTLLPLASKETKQTDSPAKERALFKLYSLGVSTNRDEWVYDDSAEALASKMQWFVSRYRQQKKSRDFDGAIKWSEALKMRFEQGREEAFDSVRVRSSLYRPFARRWYYDSSLFIDRVGSKEEIFPSRGLAQNNHALMICAHPQLPFTVHSVNALPDAGYSSRATLMFPRYVYGAEGNRQDNLTDWGVKQFEKHYGNSLPQRGRAGEGVLFAPPPVDPVTLARARALRGNLTEAENKLWQVLRAAQLGAKFRRQHPLKPFILDFYCLEHRLAIELDGGQHNDDAVAELDAARTAWLEAQGIRVLRFWNDEVLRNVEGVAQRVVEVIAELVAAPPPRPSPAGGGSTARFVAGGGGTAERLITRERIFAYVYAVLHHPAYRAKYALNLKRELPRIPLYGEAADFKKWAAWGEQLLTLHTGFEQAAPFALMRSEAPSPPAPLPQAGEGSQSAPKCKLKADKAAGCIEVDAATTLSGIPATAWDYKLGNRSALEWVLDQYKEGTPRDPTIAAHFNTYRFADYKEHVIDLLQRVTTVSVETMRIVGQMPSADATETLAAAR